MPGLESDRRLGLEWSLDMEIAVPPAELSRSFGGRFEWDSYERVERDLVVRYLHETDCVLELGGCLGGVACVANEKLADPSRHVVVEANPDLIPALTRNRDRNGRCFHIEHGIISRNSDGTFFIYDSILDGSAIASTHAVAPRAMVKVPVATFSQIETKYNLKFNALIADVEGGELAFLDEHAEFLSNVDLLIIEFHRLVIGDDGYARARRILIDLAFINIESRSSVEVWVRQTRLGIATTHRTGPLTMMRDLPPVETLGCDQLAWDGVDGLYVRRQTGAGAATGGGGLELVCGADEGRHRLGIRLRLPGSDGVYRMTAIFHPQDNVKLCIDLRDDPAQNQGLAVYEVANASVVRWEGDIRDAGGEVSEDGLIRLWGELACTGQWAIVYIGFVSPTGAVAYQGDAMSTLQLCGLEIASTVELAGPVMNMERLPPIGILDDERLAWDGIDGLHVRQVAWWPDPGRNALELISSADDRRHRLGIRFRLPDRQGAYRVSAAIRSPDNVFVYLELRDDPAINDGVVIYDVRRMSVLQRKGRVRDAGIVLADKGQIKVWAELDYAEDWGVVYIGFASPTGAISYPDGGRSSLQFRGLEIVSTARLAGPVRRSLFDFPEADSLHESARELYFLHNTSLLNADTLSLIERGALQSEARQLAGELSALAERGRYREAVTRFSRAMAVTPSANLSNEHWRPVVYYNLAIAHALADDAENVRRYVELSGLPLGGHHANYLYADRMAIACRNIEAQAEAAARGVPSIVITAMEKSASSFVSATMAALLRAPIVALSFEGSWKPCTAVVIESWARRVGRGGAVTHEHYSGRFGNIECLVRGDIRKVFVQVRDPRAALWSYFSQTQEQKDVFLNPPLLRLSEFRYRETIRWIESWLEASKHPASLSIEFVQYEGVRTNPAETIGAILDKANASITASRVSAYLDAAAVSGRIPENFRSGDRDEWRRFIPADLRHSLWQETPEAVRELLAMEP